MTRARLRDLLDTLLVLSIPVSLVVGFLLLALAMSK